MLFDVRVHPCVRIRRRPSLALNQLQSVRRAFGS
jgi:hypothetical protein